MAGTLEKWIAKDKADFAKQGGEIKARLAGTTGILDHVDDDCKEDVFYMLCFCLLVPQSKQVLAEAAEKELRKVDFYHTGMTQDELAALLRGKARFQNTKARRLLQARQVFLKSDFWPTLKAKFKSFAEAADERATKRALIYTRVWLDSKIDGMGLKLASVSDDTNILVNRDDTSVIRPIHEVKPGDNVLALDSDGVVVLSRVRNVWDHGLRESNKIICEGGRELTITKDHSVYTLDAAANICEIQGTDIKTGSFLLFVSDFCRSQIAKIDIDFTCIPDLQGTVHIKQEQIERVLPLFKQTKTPYIRKHRRNLPIGLLSQIPKECIDSLQYRSAVYDRSSVRLDANMCWILGVYAAEGSTNKKGRIEFSIGVVENDLKNQIVERFYQSFGYHLTVRPEPSRGVVRLICDCYFIVQFFRYMFEDKMLSCELTGVKHILDMNHQCITKFLLGYWAGDGWHKNDAIFTISSCSRDMTYFLRLCLSMLGVDARITLPCKNSNQYYLTCNTKVSDVGERRITRNKKDALPVAQSLLALHAASELLSRNAEGHTRLYGQIMESKRGCSKSQAIEIVTQIGLPEHGTPEYDTYERILKWAESSQVNFVKVKNVVPVGKVRVMDIETEHHNFVCSDSLLLAHNSHFMRNIGMRGLAILDSHVRNAMKERYGIGNPGDMLKKSEYYAMEDKVRGHAEKVGISLDELDLLLCGHRK